MSKPKHPFKKWCYTIVTKALPRYELDRIVKDFIKLKWTFGIFKIKDDYFIVRETKYQEFTYLEPIDKKADMVEYYVKGELQGG